MFVLVPWQMSCGQILGHFVCEKEQGSWKNSIVNEQNDKIDKWKHTTRRRTRNGRSNAEINTGKATRFPESIWTLQSGLIGVDGKERYIDGQPGTSTSLKRREYKWAQNHKTRWEFTKKGLSNDGEIVGALGEDIALIKLSIGWVFGPMFTFQMEQIRQQL